MRTSLVTSLLVLLPLGCTVSRDGQIQQTVGASGGQITVTASQDPTLAGTQLVIPPGAVPDGTVVTIARGLDQNAAGEVVVSPSVRLSPDGLQLSKPATLFVPYPGQPGNTQLVVEVTSLGKKSEQAQLLVSSAAGLAQFQITHFSDWQIVARTCTTPVPDLSEPYPIDFASPPVDLGSGSTDLAQPKYDLGAYDAGPDAHDLAPGWIYDLGPISDDGGSPQNDLAPPADVGYAAPPVCGGDMPPDQIDLAVPPKG